MLLPMKWLKEYTDVNCGARELARKMTFTGSKAEAVIEPGAEIENVVAGKLLTFDKHPGADKLYVSSVDAGSAGVVQIVTGANNIKAGDVVPVALDNSRLPGGIRIKATKMRGIVSQGMMCSLQELNLSKSDYPDAPDDGILTLNPSCVPGTDVREILGLDDSIIDFEITTNRPDCLGIIGLAREAAATVGAELTLPRTLAAIGADAADTAPENPVCINDIISVRIDNPELCRRYTARAITGVTVGESPEWMRQRLRNCGIRPINNIVDVTNYVMLETGQPLHAFDARYVAGGKIIVRNAAPGEKILTLDGGERNLDPDALVIADAEKPIAVAGVMGGENSGVFPDTGTVIIESANFEGVSVRRTAKKLGMRTESSSRFEKGLDPGMALPAADRAVELIGLIGAGTASSGRIDEYPVKREPQGVPFSPDKINALLGTDIGAGEMLEIFRKISFTYDSGSNTVTPPNFRTDISMEADLAEEVARFYDYNNIKATLPKIGPSADVSSSDTSSADVSAERRKYVQAAAYAAMSGGYSEIYTFTFQSPKAYDKLLLPTDSPLRDAVRLANPMNEDMALMRTTAIPEMFGTIADNHSRRIESAAFYEIASVFRPSGYNGDISGILNANPVDVRAADRLLPLQKTEMTLGAYGAGHTFYTMKGTVELILRGLGIKDYEFTRCGDIPYMHPGRTAYIRINRKTAGYFGEAHPTMTGAFSLPERALAGVISLEDAFKAASPERAYKPLPKYPPVPRDLALIVDSGVPAGDIIRAITKQGGSILENAEVFDVYTGAQVPEGKKSVAFSLMFRSDERTLTDDEVAAKLSKIIEALGKEFGAALRS